MDELDKQIVNHLQDGFPVCESPYQVVADQLGLTEIDLIERIKALLDSGILTRFGPLYHAEQMGGALTLAAVKVPQQQFEQITKIINAFPEVAHNYQRNHALNMWFVIATDVPDRLPEVIIEIEQQTGLFVYNMPKINEYFVGLKLKA
ncbi:MAG: Lrp/AsnC family transcriptional regulator [Methylococcaceae bacterium]|nr:Lrp/AsnC family transcriptional regulator [Methylococcaceae bacterium]